MLTLLTEDTHYEEQDRNRNHQNDHQKLNPYAAEFYVNYSHKDEYRISTDTYSLRSNSINDVDKTLSSASTPHTEDLMRNNTPNTFQNNTKHCSNYSNIETICQNIVNGKVTLHVHDGLVTKVEPQHTSFNTSTLTKIDILCDKFDESLEHLQTPFKHSNCTDQQVPNSNICSTIQSELTKTKNKNSTFPENEYMNIPKTLPADHSNISTYPSIPKPITSTPTGSSGDEYVIKQLNFQQHNVQEHSITSYENTALDTRELADATDTIKKRSINLIRSCNNKANSIKALFNYQQAFENYQSIIINDSGRFPRSISCVLSENGNSQIISMSDDVTIEVTTNGDICLQVQNGTSACARGDGVAVAIKHGVATINHYKKVYNLYINN